jgi:hypothetical protein
MRVAYFSYGMGININAWRLINYVVDKKYDVHLRIQLLKEFVIPSQMM